MLAGAINAFAGWETGAKVGSDTNVDRAIDGGESDTYLTGYASLIWEEEGDVGEEEGGVNK